jgi:CheY-like chemotaxis protein
VVGGRPIFLAEVASAAGYSGLQSMEDRRRHPRQPVAWPVRLWLRDDSFVSGQAVEASARGAWLHLNWLPSSHLRPNAIYRLDVEHPGTGQTLQCAVEIRHIEGKGVGVQLREAFGLGGRLADALPVDASSAPEPESTPDASASTAHARFVAPDRRVLARVLVIDDDASARDTLADTLTADGYHVARAGTADALATIRSDHPDVAVLDIARAESDAMHILHSVHRDNPRIGVIVLVNAEDLDVAFDSVHQGASDCLFTPVSVELLRRAVARALTAVRARAAGPA